MKSSTRESPQDGAFRHALGGMRTLAAGIEAALPPGGPRITWLEFGNKARAFELFANVNVCLGLLPGGSYQAWELVERACALEPWESVWAVEGTGYLLAQRFADGSGPIFDRRRMPVPRRCIIPLHAGLGLSLAQRSLALLGSSSGGTCLIREAVTSFARMCRANVTRGYEPIAYEALGLVTRTQYRSHLKPVASAVGAIRREMEELFWHGVGRGMYFQLENAVPASCAPWVAVAEADTAAPHERARRNMLAGLVWAMTLVNLRHPAVIELFLRYHADSVCPGGIFRNGFESAVRVWLDAAPHDLAARALALHVPGSAMALLWKDAVTEPCRRLVCRTPMSEDERLRLPSLFRCPEERKPR